MKEKQPSGRIDQSNGETLWMLEFIRSHEMVELVCFMLQPKVIEVVKSVYLISVDVDFHVFHSSSSPF